MKALLRLLPLVVALLVALALASCGRRGEDGNGERTSADSLSPALTERAQRDSARVAALVFAYYERVAARKPDRAMELFFPESLLVARESGGVDVEGRSDAVRRQVEADTGAARVRRIVLLRKAETQLLEQTYRELWSLRFVPDRPDSAPMERDLHIIQQLGNDTRWLGRMDAAAPRR